MTTKDGFQWTKKGGLRAGVPCIGAMHPPTNLKNPTDTFDATIIGAGYAGLTAARDLTHNGFKVLLLEARDRIGGRSWSSNIDGYVWEMGGTWLHWNQPHIWRDISRYQMRDQLTESIDGPVGINFHAMTGVDGTTKMSHADEELVGETAMRKFCNVDDNYGQTILSQPHSATKNPLALKYDTMSIAERVAEIRDTLTPNELTAIQAFCAVCCGTTLNNGSFYELLHWWGLLGYAWKGAVEYMMQYKFEGGQSSFSIEFWKEAMASGNLSYVFDCPVASVRDHGSSVEVKGRNGVAYKAKGLICTVPVNVLNSIAFSPLLSDSKRAAASIGHPNAVMKLNAEVPGKDLRSWNAQSYPTTKFLYQFGDGMTPAGSTHLVCFGRQLDGFHPEDESTIKAVEALSHSRPERLVFHNWIKDEYSKGALLFPSPGFVSTYLDSLRAKQGNLHFANSDWALGWRGFIDGAIEEGTRATLAVRNDLGERAMSRL